MIILFGANGYIGNEFKKQLAELKLPVFYWPNTRVTTFKDLENWYEQAGYPLIGGVINAAGYTGKPNVDACELHKDDTIHGNIVWPQILTDWCTLNDIPLGHVSSGCIYAGKRDDGKPFTENDEPNFCFKYNNSSFYSGTKAIAETIVGKWEKSYIWRLRIPFEEFDNPRNYISKILKYQNLLDAENSVSNKQEFVSACIQAMTKKVPYGIYNITNGGYITTKSITEKFKQTIAKDKTFTFVNEEEFYKNVVITPRSNCVMSNEKLLSTGIKMRTADEAFDYCLSNWTV
jgi:UDP-glucose 4,6-dehydratase